MTGLHVTMSHGRRTGFATLRAGVRRFMAVLCAFAFLTVGMTHVLCDYDGHGNASQTVLSADSTGSADQPAGSTGHAVPCDHCYGCTGAVMPLGCASAVAARSGTDLIVLPVAALRAHSPGFHTPPPKSLT
jgi:hypothetical protein